MVRESILHDVLDRLESEEAQLLVWGDTGGCFTREEVLAHIASVSRDSDPLHILDALESRAMLYKVTGRNAQKVCYRTRMGEAVHLFRNLRQWFYGQSINESKPLVSDYRFLRRARMYPKRDRSLAALLEGLSAAGIDTDKYREALSEQVGSFALAGFQERATERILLAYEQHKGKRVAPSGTIVCAGTGSGKTMAFYLPGLSAVQHDVVADPRPRVRVLAIYPRKELLKDQFNETWQQCQKLDALVVRGAGRRLRIGAYFGETPQSAVMAGKDLGGGQHRTHWLKCTTPSCKGEMRWEREDIEKGVEKLVCSACKSQANGEAIALTRNSMQQTPPDIVFTTTEMLNIHLRNPVAQRVIGIHSSDPPPLVLLDEVHTYEGNVGAQAAFLFRRWMKAAGTGPHFVGLSATLADAEAFFERLTGANRLRIRMVEANPDEMIEEGSEYLLALRGDPVSQTALLSTTIQSAMLMHRVLDHERELVSQGTWGVKTFLFTDNLDVTNRLYWQLADAEGWWAGRRGLEFNQNGPLSALRNPDGRNVDRRELRTYGQDWGIARELGYALDQSDRGRVSRTSSQDTGVDSDADMIVATSSLEVGFNDPKVGAVIQHKAPRSVASYLQRKGRAGRPRAMRPWTVVVLSDFGRDRVVYQHYEQLLSPEIKQQRLPIANSHVHRMQACLAVLEWIGAKVHASMWRVLNYPRSQKRALLSAIHELVQDCLKPGSLQQELTQYVASALKLSDEEVQRAFWQSPRPVFLEFLPLLRRRIATKWGAWDQSKMSVVPWSEANQFWRSPVPEHIPDQLYSDLNVPTLNILLERGRQPEQKQMDFFQGLQEFAPGRISKRFAERSATGVDWLVPQDFDADDVQTGAEVGFEVDEAFSPTRTELGSVFDAHNQANLPVSQPHFVRARGMLRTGNLTETTNAQLLWGTVFRELRKPVAERPPRGALWANALAQVAFCLHKNQTQLEVVRYSTGAKAELKFRREGPESKKKHVTFTWTDRDQPVAVGTRLWVDAVKLQFLISDISIENALADPELSTKLRLGFFQDGVRSFDVFREDQFSADWVFECVIAAIALEMTLSRRPIASVISDVLSDSAKVPLAAAPRLILQSQWNEDTAEVEGEEGRTGRLIQQLEHLLTDSSLRSDLQKISGRLYEPLASSSEAVGWGRRVLGKTLAAACQSAVSICLPDSDERSVVADVVISGEEICVYLSEQESGGAGVAAQLQERFAEDPVGLLNVFARTLNSSEYEQLDDDIRSYLAELQIDDELRRCANLVRSADSFQQRADANRLLKGALRAAGFHLSHSFLAVLYSRVLRPGSNEATDARLDCALSQWTDLEEGLGFELPMHIASVTHVVREAGGIAEPAMLYQKARGLQAVLWPRGMAVRQYALQAYNRFDISKTRTERVLGEFVCSSRAMLLSVDDPLWLKLAHEQLGKTGRVDIEVPRWKLTELNRVLAQLQTVPFDAMGLFFYPRVAGMNRKGGGVVLSAEFAEAAH